MTESGYQLVRILESDDLGFVLGFETFPDSPNEAALLSQDGRLWRIDVRGGRVVELFGDISDRVVAGDEEGLLGLAFSPDFASDRLLYLYYTTGGPRRSVLSRFTVTGTTLDPSSEEVLLEVPQPSAFHNGGQIAFGPDGYLYLGLGDGGDSGHGQDLSTLLSSLLRLDVSEPGGYRIPPDNPLPGARAEIYAYGFRNPWRFSFDRVTGNLWLGDVGQDEWEEVNRVDAGDNYGWDILEGFECFREPSCSAAGLEDPWSVYPHDGDGGCSITGGYVYRGNAAPELDGWYVYGDFCFGRIWALDTVNGGPATLLYPATPADPTGNIPSFGILPDGELVVISMDDSVFTLSRLARRSTAAAIDEEPDEPPIDKEPDEPPIDEEPDAPPVDEEPDAPPVDEEPDAPPVDEDPGQVGVLSLNPGGQFVFWRFGPARAVAVFTDVKIAWLFEPDRLIWISYIPALGQTNFVLTNGAVLWIVSLTGQDIPIVL